MSKDNIYPRFFLLMDWRWSMVIMFLSFMVLIWADYQDDAFFLGSILFIPLIALIVFRFLFRIFALKFVQISTSATATVIKKFTKLESYDTAEDTVYFIHLQHTDASKNIIWEMKVKESFNSEIRTGDRLKLYYAEIFPNLMLLETEANAYPHPLNVFKSGSV